MNDPIDDLAVALSALREAAKTVPAMNGREYDSLGIQVNKALDRYESSRELREAQRNLIDVVMALRRQMP